MKHNHKIKLMLILVCFLGIALVTSTFAYLTKVGSESVTVTLGNVEYETTGQTIVINDCLPSFELLPAEYSPVATFHSTSNVESNIRVVMKITMTDESNQIMDMTNDLHYQKIIGFDDTSAIKIIADGWNLDNSNIVSDSDHCVTSTFYYFGNGTTEQTISNGTVDVEFLTSIVLNGDIVSIEASGKTLNFEIIFEAKQASYVNWQEIGSINFTTGIN